MRVLSVGGEDGFQQLLVLDGASALRDAHHRLRGTSDGTEVGVMEVDETGQSTLAAVLDGVAEGRVGDLGWDDNLGGVRGAELSEQSGSASTEICEPRDDSPRSRD